MHGWSTKIVDPDNRTKHSAIVDDKVSSTVILSNENCNWQPLKEVFCGNETDCTFYAQLLCSE